MEADHSADRRELKVFLQVLTQRCEDGQPFIVVGGHAANYWAALYLSREPRLASHLPFTSKDLDLIGSRENAERVAQALGWNFSDPPVGGGPVQGVVTSRESEKPLRVEFLSEIKGVPQDTILEFARKNSVQPEGTEEVIPIRVLDPVMMLAGKIRNAVEIDQDAPDKPRQDVKHVAILSLCIPHFLEDIIAQNFDQPQRIDTARKYITILRALKNSYSGRKFEAQHPSVIRWPELIPQSIRNLPFDTATRMLLRDLTADITQS